MTFRILVPYEVTSANIEASNIPLEPLYSSGASYTFEGNIVRGSDGQIYQYVGTTGTTHESPTANEQTDWVLLGPPNRLAPFDILSGIDQPSPIGTQAEWPDEITYTLSGLGRVMGIGYINIDALAVETEITELTPGDLLDETAIIPDLANVGASLWQWMYLPIVKDDQHFVNDLNAPPDATFEIKIDNTGKTARAGSIVLGLVQEIGATLLKPRWSINSFTLATADKYKRSLVRFAPGKRIEIEVYVVPGAARRVQRLLETFDGQTCVYIPADNRPEYTVYGLQKGVTMTGEANGHTFLSITVESV